MDGTADFESTGKRAFLRWVLCFLLILTVHSAAAVAMLYERERGETTEVSSAVIMDFAALPTVDAPARDVAPGEIEQVQTEAAPPPSEEKPDPNKAAEPEKQPERTELTEAKPVQQSPEPKPAVEEPLPVKELPQVEQAEATLATVASPPPKVTEEKKEESEKKSEKIEALPLATAPETTAPTAASVRSASLVNWKLRISTHLQRFKRYPPEAAARRQYGTAEVSFTIDRNGHVKMAKLHRGSGYETLDEATMELIRRAQPMPRPPGDVPGVEFSFTVPVKFNRQ
jgi:protein TonB